MAAPRAAYLSWPSEKVDEFRRDYAAGMKNRELAAKYGICSGTAVRIEQALGLIGTREFCCTKLITRPIAAFIAEMYPDHPNREIRDAVKERFGVALGESTVTNFAYSRGITKSAEQKRRTDVSKTSGMRRAWAERKGEIVARRAASLKATAAREKRRLLHGLPQKTRMEIQISPVAKKRQQAKGRLCWVNNYFSDGRGSRNLYYDGQTKRSRLMEEKYRDVFTFLPADGFDEKDSVFTKKINWRKAQ